MTKHGTISTQDGSNVKIGIVVARWNNEYTSALESGVRQALQECHVTDDNIITVTVPGSFELLYGASSLIKSSDVDALVCIGVLIQGQTRHFEYIAHAVSQGIMTLNIQQSTPVIFGVLTCLTEQQAQERSSGDGNHGYGWGLSAVEMALIHRKNI